MTIYTLGSGHGDSTFSRFNSSTVYETESGTLYFVDAGAPAEALLRRKGLHIKNVRACFITHMHDDHAGGLSGLIKQILKYSKEREFPFVLSLPEEGAIEALKNWMFALHETADSNCLDYRFVDDGEIYEDDELTVTAIRTRHLRTLGRTKGDPCSFAYMLHFKKENKTVLHTGDLTNDFSDFPRICAERYFDVCLCEATHYAPCDAIGPFKKANFGKLIFTHISDKWHTRIGIGWEADNGEKRLLSEFKELAYPCQIAHDGDEFVL